MRILRVLNISTKTLAVNLLAVSAISSTATAQSFDYPTDSPTVFDRRAKQTEFSNAQPTAPNAFARSNSQSMPALQPPRVAKPSMISKLFSPKTKSAKPIFGSPLQNGASTNLPSYSTGKSAFLDPFAHNIKNRHSEGNQHAIGYETGNQNNQVRPASFDQYGDNKPHSILEFAKPERVQSPITSAPAAIDPTFKRAPVNFNPATRSTPLTVSRKFTPSPAAVNPIVTPLPTTQPEKRTAQLAVEPVAKVAERVSMPSNAFKQEFDKAYRYINQSADKNGASMTRVAKADADSFESNLRDFSTQPRSQKLSSDFTPDRPLSIEIPRFIPAERSEQSPNASRPDFRPSPSPGDFEEFATQPVAKPSTAAPIGKEDRALLEALRANEIEGDFEDNFGDVSQWEQPKGSGTKQPLADFDLDPPSRSSTKRTAPAPADDLDLPTEPSDQQTLEEQLAELSKPLLRTKAPASSSPTPAQAPMISFQESPTWWKQQVNQPLHPGNQTVPIDSNGLVYAALQNSPRIAAVSKNPLIRELQVVEADAEFDPVRFVQTQFQDRVDPVGNALTIGGGSPEPFLRENIWTGEAGIRRKLRTGADLTVSQQLGFRNSNSLNFIPNDQGTATLALNVTQPLLKGRGRYFNQAQILIAQSTGGVAWEIFQQNLQEELEGVVGAYWQLYLERSVYLQRKRNVERGQVILDRLNGRRSLDSLPAQIARARSSVQTRKTELANAFRNIRNAETEIRRRVADRNWMANQTLELLPNEMPTAQNVGLELDQVVKTALNHRPEIRESMRRIKIAGVQRDVSQNELLPELSFLVGTYVSALQGDSDVFGAVGDQFGDVTPGYSFGLEYELPRFNRAARSRFQQRHLQFKRLQNELEEVIQNVIAESQIALRRINSALETLAAAEQAIDAARIDLKQNEMRWESFALVEGDIAEGVSPTAILDQLLDSQERLSQAEIIYAQAELELKISELALQRSMGTLLMHQQVTYDRDVVSDTPRVHIQKQPTNVPTPIQQDNVFPSAIHSQEQPVFVE